MSLQPKENQELVPELLTKRGGAREGAGRKPGALSKGRPLAEALKVMNLAEERHLWRVILGLEKLRKNETKPDFAALKYANEMRRGKPFEAVNPHARRDSGGDHKLIVAIQNLVPGGAKSLQSTTKRKAKPRPMPVLEAGDPSGQKPGGDQKE